MTCKPEDLLYKKVNLNLFRLFWPEFITTLSRYTDSMESLESKLFELGKNIGEYIGKYWNIKYANFKKMIKQTFKFFSSSNNFKINKYQNKVEIIDKDCILCRTAIEATKIHYCVVVSGFLEGILTKITDRFILENFPKNYIGRTKMSISSGDPVCKHEIDFVFE